MPEPTHEELLDQLRTLWATRGKLTTALVEASDCTRSPNIYIRRFGSLMAAYKRIGYPISDRQRATSDRYFRKPRVRR